jgi:hypothetical protein
VKRKPKGPKHRNLCAWCGLVSLPFLLSGCARDLTTSPEPSEGSEHVGGTLTMSSFGFDTPPPCAEQKACADYLRAAGDRVQNYWGPPRNVGSGKVVARVRVGQDGSLTWLETLEATNAELRDTCIEALENAELPPAPDYLPYMVIQAKCEIEIHSLGK